jgi:hypothetical protein
LWLWLAVHQPLEGVVEFLRGIIHEHSP